ncbi:hypothetical protein OSB04_002253 [Centaurea solstitialis]|uniref:Large ribosomal subunit protein bL34c n=1 Tax=Centaurea solstitialis TaxID=347529 RepID=A0AA38WMK7_9ASTR|nr:hypothetical protein OSB04_002253 [Centaurea solstitialis]
MASCVSSVCTRFGAHSTTTSASLPFLNASSFSTTRSSLSLKPPSAASSNSSGLLHCSFVSSSSLSLSSSSSSFAGTGKRLKAQVDVVEMSSFVGLNPDVTNQSPCGHGGSPAMTPCHSWSRGKSSVNVQNGYPQTFSTPWDRGQSIDLESQLAIVPNSYRLIIGSSLGWEFNSRSGIEPVQRRGLVVKAGKKFQLAQTKRNRSRKSLARTHGFRLRMRTTSGRALLKRRREKGRWILCTKSNPSSGKRA